jgi:hypothetical protein
MMLLRSTTIICILNQGRGRRTDKSTRMELFGVEWLTTVFQEKAVEVHTWLRSDTPTSVPSTPLTDHNEWLYATQNIRA